MYRACIDGTNWDIASPSWVELVNRLEESASEYLGRKSRMLGRLESVKDMVDSSHVREPVEVYFGVGIKEDVDEGEIPYVVYGITKW